MRQLVRAGVVFTAVAVCASLASCKSDPKPPDPTRVVLNLSASADVNQSSPVVVRLFQLQSSDRFESAEFFKLFDDEVGALGPTLVARKELQLWPSQNQKFDEELRPATRVMGILAGFKDLSLGKWRLVVPITLNKTTVVEVVFDRSSVTSREVQ